MRFFEPNNTLIIRDKNGEKHLQYSSFHKWLMTTAVMAGFILVTGFVALTLFRALYPGSETDLNRMLQQEYEARIDGLMKERDGLITTLDASKVNESKLIHNLGRLQDLLFQTERENYELSENVSAMRTGLIKKQNDLNAISLQLDAQSDQLNAALNGEALSGSNTLQTITQTLSETASSRDQARAQVQLLREQIEVADAKQKALEKKRALLFSQIEDSVEESLKPLQSTLEKTGLNVNSLLNTIRRSYSGVGGIDADASFDMFGKSDADEKRVENLISNLDTLGLYSFAIQSLPVGKPVKANYRMSSGFGYRIHPISKRRKMHTGQDMAGPYGTPIYATGNGVVVSAGWTGGYGKAVRIKHEFGLETFYAHMSKILVKAGQRVALGQQIGKMGSTGQSTGSHLHYEMKLNGKFINPMNLLRASNYVQ